MQHFNLPRALRGAVRAEETPQQLFAQINGAIGDLRQRHDDNINDVREHVDNLSTAMNAMQGQLDRNVLSTPGASAMLPVEPDYTKAFASFIRKGDGEAKLSELQSAGDRAAIQAALSVGSDANGGLLAPIEWDREISKQQVTTSPMRKLAKVMTTSVGAFTTLWQSGNPGSGWVGETAARPQTSNPTFDPITFAAGEIYANPAATQRILDDAAIDIGAWLVDALRIEFNRQENIAFLSGSGVNQPAGLLTYVTGGANDGTHPGGNLTVVEEAVAVDALIDFMYGLGAPYRQNATWVLSSLTAAALTRLKDADGNLIWRESLIVGQPATLLGRPVEIDEGMPGPTAGNIAIAFGDFRAGYLVNDRYSSLRLLRDPFTNKPFVHFYATKRVGGGVLDPNAIRLLRIPV
ncbi:phage major capsid protein [Qipengyuania sp. YG27]|uniref:Phage major capsid protein n=1 Tax=Qipengyuania mesophila TaxID=2867246 RepID=A0ABS7JSM2_9SPHN|nr:phage major capsid protein [Qipengyuania mesophila]MBX7500647.1 phage major capsid protein [Qipengyuania mesophila]